MNTTRRGLAFVAFFIWDQRWLLIGIAFLWGFQLARWPAAPLWHAATTTNDPTSLPELTLALERSRLGTAIFGTVGIVMMLAVGIETGWKLYRLYKRSASIERGRRQTG